MTFAELPAAATAIPIGIAFGVVLERAGLGDPRVIRGQLLLRDFTVLRVMFGAIVTAMLGVLWLGNAGLVDVAAIAIPPTDLGAQALGGVIFGGGFALAALCPGTACVAAASLRREGVATVAGVFVGTIALPMVWPVLSLAVREAPEEGAHLYSGAFPRSLVVVLITLIAVIAMRVAVRVEQGSIVRWWLPSRVESVALTLAFAFAAVEVQPGAGAGPLAAIAGEIAREDDHVDALQLATWIREGRAGLRVIDVREREDDDSTLYSIPGAERVALTALPAFPVEPGEHIVLYSDGGTHAAQGWVLLRARGISDVRVLRDGLAAWEDDVLSPVIPPAADAQAQKRADEVRALSLWFGGRPRVAGPFESTTSHSSAPRRRRRTC
jgi:uncharacterized protein